MKKWVYLEKTTKGKYHVYLKSCEEGSDAVTKTFIMSVSSYAEIVAIRKFWDTVKDHLE